METATVHLPLHDPGQIETYRRDLAGGGLFVPGITLPRDTVIEIIIDGAGGRLVLSGVVVWEAPDGGVGVELRGMDADERAQVDSLLALGPAVHEATEPDADRDFFDDELDSDDEPPSCGADGPARIPSLHQRLRGLSMVEATKVALNGELHERVALERIYSKAVWEPLLRNQRLSPPEVARIARMGTLPRPMLETIVGNKAWLSSPEVRRALLANPRLGVDLVPRVLRMLSKPELKLAPTQTAYPAAVRELARRMLQGG